ncbi:twin-arginine translocation signal domain-containing protein [Novosphingobium sp. ZN18A2]|uniref:twin-arginine translocation signal domain-containing protein n=1 Tax=Novosphingobium sp. ZN18A2 TaxID=3079861 RepID=UPI0030D41AF6
MTAVSRRSVLKAGAIAGAAAALPLTAARGEARVVVYDSRIAGSAAFAGGRGIDLARGILSVRRELARVPRGATIEGLTRWSDWVGLRGMLQDRGFRTVGEVRRDRAQAHFRWTMRPR